MSAESTLHPEVLAARDLLVTHRTDLDAARAAFRWPRPATFNFVTDWFDGLAAQQPEATALWIVDGEGATLARATFADLAARSRAAAAFLQEQGVGRGDRILVMLGNQIELWEVMLGAIRLGAVLIPSTPQLAPADLSDRVARGRARLIVANAADTPKFASVDASCARVSVGDADGWVTYALTEGSDAVVEGASAADDQLFLYFTSGTTSKPKLVEHTMSSYPIGHLSTMYWMGVQPGDVHLNISSPGWAKHAWSNLFAPWLAGATILVFNYARFDAERLLEVLERAEVTTFCAPPTVWRMLVQSDLTKHRVQVREALSAGEPLNPEVIERIRHAWDVTIRDGYGQTEMTCAVGNSPGQEIVLGSMGRPLPGYEMVLLDPATGEEKSDEGELCVRLDPPPVSLMTGYRDDADTPNDALMEVANRDGAYHTGDVVAKDADGRLTYVGRADDVFKASDYRISPFELESVLVEHEAVAEAAIVPSPDPVRLAVPKAHVVLAAGWEPSAETAQAILQYARTHLAPYNRIRRIEFGELPKTISGKIRRVELRGAESTERREGEFWDSDFTFE